MSFYHIANPSAVILILIDIQIFRNQSRMISTVAETAFNFVHLLQIGSLKNVLSNLPPVISIGHINHCNVT